VTAEHVHIHYTSGEESVPLTTRDELAGILRARGAYVSYEITQAWWYRPITWLRIQGFWLLPRR
jgi:hypothetical protein